MCVCGGGVAWHLHVEEGGRGRCGVRKDACASGRASMGCAHGLRGRSTRGGRLLAAGFVMSHADRPAAREEASAAGLQSVPAPHRHRGHNNSTAAPAR